MSVGHAGIGGAGNWQTAGPHDVNLYIATLGIEGALVLASYFCDQSSV